MSHKAYLVGYLDITKDPPVLDRMWIFSDRADLLTQDLNRNICVDLMHLEDDTFQQAVEGLKQYLSLKTCHLRAGTMEAVVDQMLASMGSR